MLIGKTAGEGTALVDPSKLAAGDPATLAEVEKWSARFEDVIKLVAGYAFPIKDANAKMT